jgi:hypothetical protein
MTQFNDVRGKKECDYYLRGICRNGDNCSFAHLRKQYIRITYEDKIYKGYLLGCFLDNKNNEVYIPGYKMNEFYSKTGSTILDNHVNQIYEVTLSSLEPHCVHGRHLVSTIIKRISHQDNKEDSQTYFEVTNSNKDENFEEIFEELNNTSDNTTNNNSNNTNNSNINEDRVNSSFLDEVKNTTYSKAHIDKFFEEIGKKCQGELLKRDKDIEELKKQISILQTNIQELIKNKEDTEISVRRSKRLKVN